MCAFPPREGLTLVGPLAVQSLSTLCVQQKVAGWAARGDHEASSVQHSSTSCSLHCLHPWCVIQVHLPVACCSWYRRASPAGRGRHPSPSPTSLDTVAAASAMTNVLSLPCQPDLAAWAWEIPSLMQTMLTSRSRDRVSDPLCALVALQTSPLEDVASEQHLAKAVVKKARQSREQSRNKQISLLAFHRHHGCRSSWLLIRGLQAGSLPCQWWNLAST